MVSSSIKTGEQREDSYVSDSSIKSNISSAANQNQYDNARELEDLEEDDETEWTMVEKRPKPQYNEYQDETLSISSNRTSNLTERTNENSSTRSAIGRGRGLSSYKR